MKDIDSDLTQQLSTEIHAHQLTKETLESQLEQSRTRELETADFVSELKEVNSYLKESAYKLESKADDLRARLEEATEAIDHLEDELQLSRENERGLVESCASYEHSLRQLVQRDDDREAELLQLNQKTEALARQIIEAKERSDEAQKEREGALKELHVVLEQMGKEKSSLEDRLAAVVDALAKAESAAGAADAHAKAELADHLVTKEKLSAESAEVAKLERFLDIADSEVQSLKNELEREWARAEAAHTQLQQALSLLKDERSDVGDTERRLVWLEHALAQSEEEIHRYKIQNDGLEKQIAVATEQHDNVVGELQTERWRSEELEARLKEANSTQAMVNDELQVLRLRCEQVELRLARQTESARDDYELEKKRNEVRSEV